MPNDFPRLSRLSKMACQKPASGDHPEHQSVHKNTQSHGRIRMPEPDSMASHASVVHPVQEEELQGDEKGSVVLTPLAPFLPRSLPTSMRPSVRPSLPTSVPTSVRPSLPPFSTPIPHHSLPPSKTTGRPSVQSSDSGCLHTGRHPFIPAPIQSSISRCLHADTPSSMPAHIQSAGRHHLPGYQHTEPISTREQTSGRLSTMAPRNANSVKPHSKPGLPASKSDRPRVPYADPRFFLDQVPNGAAPAMVDHFAFKTHLLDRATGELINVSSYLKQALRDESLLPVSERTLVPVRSKQDGLVMTVSPTCRAFLYLFEDFLCISANPNKVARAWNEFSPEPPGVAIKRLTHGVISRLRSYGLPRLVFRNHRLTRLDLCQMIHCSTPALAASTFGLLRLHLRGVTANGVVRETSCFDNTLYVGQKSRLHSIKMYRVSAKKHPRLEPQQDAWVRLELTLRRPELEALALRGAWTPHDLNGVFQRYVRHLRETFHQWRPDRAVHPPRKLPDELHLAWFCWERGHDLRFIPEFKDRFGALCKAFFEHGIDVREPPTPRRMKPAQALKLHQLLDPDRYDSNCRTSPEVLDALRGL